MSIQILLCPFPSFIKILPCVRFSKEIKHNWYFFLFFYGISSLAQWNWWGLHLFFPIRLWGRAISRATDMFSQIYIYIFFFSTFNFILEYSWFTMLCSFQLYNKVIQLYLYMYLFSFKFFSQLGCYIILSRVPCALLSKAQRNAPQSHPLLA